MQSGLEEIQTRGWESPPKTVGKTGLTKARPCAWPKKCVENMVTHQYINGKLCGKTEW